MICHAQGCAKMHTLLESLHKRSLKKNKLIVIRHNHPYESKIKSRNYKRTPFRGHEMSLIKLTTHWPTIMVSQWVVSLTIFKLEREYVET